MLFQRVVIDIDLVIGVVRVPSCWQGLHTHKSQKQFLGRIRHNKSSRSGCPSISLLDVALSIRLPQRPENRTMLSFLAKRVPRTITANQNPVAFDGGRSFIEFKAPTDRYLVLNRWPPSSSEANRNIALRPPLHWHRHQTETFHVLHGVAEFVCDGQKIIKKAGDMITIPAKAIHTFRNISESDELLIEFVLEPMWRERDEAFFRMFREVAQCSAI